MNVKAIKKYAGNRLSRVRKEEKTCPTPFIAANMADVLRAAVEIFGHEPYSVEFSDFASILVSSN